MGKKDFDTDDYDDENDVTYHSVVYFGLGEGEVRGGVEWGGRGSHLWVFSEVKEEGHWKPA